MNNKKKLVKLTTGITALALSLTLTAGCDCKKRDKFYIHLNLYGERAVNRYDYISIEYINNYYVLELYNKVLDRTILYIAYRYEYTSGESKYTNIFTNYKIAYDNDKEDYYEFINVTPLSDFLIEYDLIQEKYTYEDMQDIFDIIKKKYIYEKDNSLSKKLIIDNRYREC